MSEFAVIQVQLVGNVENWELACSTDGVRRHSFAAAFRHGVEWLDHDDFWIAEVNHGRLLAILHSDGQRRPDPTQAEIAAVVRACGLAS
jgi:hypothetical protein